MRKLTLVLVVFGLLAVPSISQALTDTTVTWELNNDPSTLTGWWTREPGPGWYAANLDNTPPGQEVIDIGGATGTTSGEIWFGIGPHWEPGGGFSSVIGSPSGQYITIELELDNHTWQDNMGAHYKREFEYYGADPGGGGNSQFMQLAIGKKNMIYVGHKKPTTSWTPITGLDHSAGKHTYAMEIDVINHVGRVYLDGGLVGLPGGYDLTNSDVGQMYDTLRYKSAASVNAESYDWETVTIRDGQVPEPATLVVLALGGACVLLRKKR